MWNYTLNEEISFAVHSSPKKITEIIYGFGDNTKQQGLSHISFLYDIHKLAYSDVMNKPAMVYLYSDKKLCQILRIFSNNMRFTTAIR